MSASVVARPIGPWPQNDLATPGPGPQARICTNLLHGVERDNATSREILAGPDIAPHLSAIVHGLGSEAACSWSDIYDSHYFLAAAEFLALVPDGDARTGFFLVHNMRARLDPPRKLRGMLLGKIKGAMRDELGELLASTKTRLERQANERLAQP